MQKIEKKEKTGEKIIDEEAHPYVLPHTFNECSQKPLRTQSYYTMVN